MKVKRPLRRIGLLALALVMTIGTGAVHAAAQNDSSAAVLPSTASLPPPFRGWNVTVTPHEGQQQVLDVSFDSPLLQRRITNRVYLPDSYRADGPPSPVMYYLHGTVLPILDNPLFGPITKHEALLDAVGPAGGAVQTDLFRFETQLHKARFVVVAPDTSRDGTICDTCIWLDGRKDIVPNLHPVTAETLPADSYLHTELYPLIEELFNVRTDRGGRGVMGFSMGAIAAYLQSMRHPDKYALTGAVSGALDVLDEVGARAIWESVGYMRDQGYGTGLTHEAYWRGHNPKDIASNLSGIDHEVMTTAGDACLSLTSLTHPDCRRLPPVTNPAATVVETIIARQYGLYSRTLPKAGVKEVRVQSPGVHGANNDRVYAEKLVPWANQVFERGVVQPAAFRFRSVDTEFSVWDYQVSVQRNGVEFLDMTDVARNGRSFQLRGSGVVTVLTPAEFTPGSSYQVTGTADNGDESQQTVIADDGGRLRIVVDLGRAAVVDKVLQGLGLKAQRTVKVTVQ